MKSGLNSTSSSASPARTWSSNLGNLNTTFPEVFVSVLFFETAAISLTESAAECSLVEPARTGISRSVALGKTLFCAALPNAQFPIGRGPDCAQVQPIPGRPERSSIGLRLSAIFFLC